MACRSSGWTRDVHRRAVLGRPFPRAQNWSVIAGLWRIQDCHRSYTQPHSTEGKCYSIAEMRGYLQEIGFADMQFRETVADRSIITARKPA